MKIILSFLFIAALFMFVSPSQANAANRYWVGGTGNWSDDDNHWASVSNGAPADGNVPTSADNCYFDANSFSSASQTVTVNADANCLDMIWTGATNTPTLAFSSWVANVYGNLTLISAMSITYSSYYGFTFKGSGTQNITTGGITSLPEMTLSHTGTVSLQDAWAGIRSINHNSGTLTTNNNNMTWTNGGYFSTGGASAKTINLGSSTIQIGTDNATNNNWGLGGSNITVNAGTSTINLSGQFTGAGKTYNIVNMTATGGKFNDSSTFGTLTIANTSAKTDSITLTAGTTQTVTGTLTINGTSATSRILIQSGTLGSAATLNAATVSVSNADFMDITGAGAGNWNLSAITGLSGDAGGNTGITFTTSVAQTSAGTQAWSVAAGWSGRVPLPQDDVTVSHSKSIDMPRIGRSITFSGTPTATGNTTINLYGSLTLVSGMTFTNGYDIYFRGRGAYTLTSAGKTFAGRTFQAMPGGTLTQQDDFVSSSASYPNFIGGTWDANNYNYTAKGVYIAGSASASQTMNMGSGIWTMNGTDAGITFWQISGTTTLNAQTSSIVLTNSTTNARSFDGGGKTYNNVTVQGAGNYALTITGSNTFNTFTVDRSQAAKTVTFTAGTTQTMANFVSATSGTTVTTLNSTGTGWNIVKSGGGTINVDYMNITYSTATPANTWSAGTNSTNGGNNSGWLFTDTLQIIAGKGQDAYQLQVSSGNLKGYVSGSASGTTSLGSGSWRHVVMTYDGANIRLYVDGVLQVTTAKTGAIGTNSGKLEIGSGMAGKLDNVRVYSRALSSVEILAASESYNPSVQISDLQKGLVGNWKMDGSAKDFTPYGNNGTVTGATLTTDRKGGVNKAYSFNGVDQYITLGNAGTNPSVITVAAWIKTGTNGDIVHKYSTTPGNKSWWLGVSVSKAVFQVSVDGTNMVAVTGNTAITTNTWTHVVGVYNGANVAIYVNGQSDKTPTSLTGSIATSTQNIVIAGSWISGAFNGPIDGVRIYNRALSAAEILDLYQEYDSSVQISDLQKGLVGQWKMDGNAKDNTPYENNGTVTGATLTTDRKGQLNKTYHFDNDDGGPMEYVSVAGNSNLTRLAGSSLTISFWAKATLLPSETSESNYRILQKDADASSGANGNYLIYLNESASKLRLGFGYTNSAGTTSYNIAPTTYDISKNTWYFVALTYTYPTGSDATKPKIYLNGAELTLGSWDSTPNGTVRTDNADSFYIGDDSYGTTNYLTDNRGLNGDMDDVRIYNRALSAAEITALYESY